MELHTALENKLEHRCKLPFSMLNWLLGEGHEFGEGVIIWKLTSIQGHSVYMGMTEFTEDNYIHLPMQYILLLGINVGDPIRVDIEKTHNHTDLIHIQPQTDGFAKLPDPEGALKTYIQKELVAITKGITFHIEGQDIDVVGFDLPTENYTATNNFDLHVDILPSLETIKRERKEREEAERKEREEAEQKHKAGMKLGGRNLSREERLKKLLERVESATIVQKNEET